MTERGDGSRRIGEGTYYCGSRQATLAEKRVSLTLEFKIAFREITPQTVVELYPSRDLTEVLGSAALKGDVERQRRLLGALLEDEEALRKFVACAVMDEIVAGGGELLRSGLSVTGEEEEALRPLIEVLGGEVAEYYARVGGEIFEENIELLIYSTPVKCLALRWRMVDMSEEGGESDKCPM